MLPMDLPAATPVDEQLFEDAGRAGVVGGVQDEPASGLGMQAVHRSLPDHPSGTDDTHVIGHLVDLGEQVAGDDDGAAEAVGHLAYELADLMDAAGVEAVGGFVEQQEPGMSHECGRDTEALPHTEREVSHTFLGRRSVTEADDLEHLVDTVLGQPAQPAYDVEVLAGGEMWVAAGTLYERADVLQDLEAVVGGLLLAEDRDGTACGVGQAEDYLHGRRLACAVGAEEPVYRTLGNVEVDVVDDGRGTVALGEVRRGDDGAGLGGDGFPSGIGRWGWNPGDGLPHVRGAAALRLHGYRCLCLGHDALPVSSVFGDVSLLVMAPILGRVGCGEGEETAVDTLG